jgi:LPXTG-motif cell wall-anchored protein
VTSFRRTALKTASSGGIIATALIAFTGVPAQATLLPSCNGVTAIPATEDALRAAVAGTDPVICIEPGTIDFSSAGSDSTPGFVEITRSVSIIGAAGVILDGGGESEILKVTSAEDDVHVLVQNLTLQNGHSGIFRQGNAIWFDGPGSLTILDSTFTGNDGKGTSVFVNDSTPSDGSLQPTVTVNNSIFSNNGASIRAPYGGAVMGYGDVTITDSTFVGNSGSYVGTVAGSGALMVRGNLFDSNHANDRGGAISTLSGNGDITIANNTFRGNTSSGYGGAIFLSSAATVVDNTFVDNEAGTLGDSIYNDSSGGVTLFANIFAASVVAPTVGELAAPDSFFIDLGANISTFEADATYLTTSALTPGHVGATFPSIGLGPLSDNGGPTQTMALEPPSIAIGAVTPGIFNAAASITKPSVDQRGASRGDGTTASDSGAYEYSAHPVVPVDPAELAKTGANTGSDSNTSIALAGGALLGGAALIGTTALRNKRRRESV